MLTKTILVNASKFFRIGDFLIAARNLNSDFFSEPVNIPGSFMAFEKNFSEEADFHFVVDDSVCINKGNNIFEAENFQRYSIYECGDDAWAWVHMSRDDLPEMALKVKKDFSEIILTSGKEMKEELLVDLGYMFAYAMLQREACVLHGTILECHGKGFLILARSGVGKSTHSHLWRDEENALIINGDRCLLRKIDGKWYAYGSPWCGNSGEYVNRKVALTDIVFLDRGPINHVVPVSEFPGTMRLLESIKAPIWNQDLYVKAMDYCQELAQNISMWNLHCTPDVESVHVLKKALFGEEE